jgi:hypothetical protein
MSKFFLLILWTALSLSIQDLDLRFTPFDNSYPFLQHAGNHGQHMALSLFIESLCRTSQLLDLCVISVVILIRRCSCNETLTLDSPIQEMCMRLGNFVFMGENILSIAKLVTLHSDHVMCKPITVFCQFCSYLCGELFWAYCWIWAVSIVPILQYPCISRKTQEPLLCQWQFGSDLVSKHPWFHVHISSLLYVGNLVVRLL